MLKVLLFSLSISIDAFGLSLNTLDKNYQIKPTLFLLLNILNSLFLTFFLIVFKNISIFSTPILSKLGDLFLMIFGLNYIFSATKKLFGACKKNVALQFASRKEFKTTNLFVLIYLFIFENLFASAIFYSNFSFPWFFVLSNFTLHAFFFMVGSVFGEKIMKRIEIDPSFVSGIVFFALGIFGLVE